MTAADDRLELVRLATTVAEQLDGQSTSSARLVAGVIRRLAQHVATGGDAERRCPCGAELGDDPRSEYCSPRCKQRAYRARRQTRDASVTDVDD